MSFIPQPIPPAGYPLSEWTPPVVGRVAPAPLILADRFVATRAEPSTWDIGTLLEGDDPTDAALLWSFSIEQNGTDERGERHGGIANGSNGARLYDITKALPGAAMRIGEEGRRVAEPFAARRDISGVVSVGTVLGGSSATGALELTYHNEHTGELAARRFGGV